MRLKREYPGWGAPKIREKLRQQFTGPHLPAISTVHAVLDRHGLVHHRRRRRGRASGTALSRPHQPNVLWCADYKGEFMLGNPTRTDIVCPSCKQPVGVKENKALSQAMFWCPACNHGWIADDPEPDPR